MPKVWNLGNTTVRNPNRLRDGLILLKDEFAGNLHGSEQESLFSRRLNETGIIDSEGSNPDWFGRKWRSAFVKLGFLTEKFSQKEHELLSHLQKDFGFRNCGYEVTPAGNLLIAADSLGAVEDVFTRQLIQHEIPSPIEGSFPGGSMKPFIFFLQILNELRRLNQPGLNKLEIGAFLQLFRNHVNSAVTNTVNSILEYRTKRESCRDRREKDRFDYDTLKRASRDFVVGSVAAESLVDYADTTVRYSKMTGLIAEAGSRVVLRETKIVLINAILERALVFRATSDPANYLKEFYSGSSIPTDNSDFAHQEIIRMSNRLESLGKQTPYELLSRTKDASIQQLEQVRYKLLELVNQSQEEIFAFRQGGEEAMRDIVEGLTVFGSGSARRKFSDPPTYFEWIVWRSFLAIDHIVTPIHTTRRFPLDEDLLPRHPAPAGGPDMMFEFDDFILVVEVTLKTSSRQEADEGEPVRRHVAGINQSTSKDVYGVFIAPSIDTNTAETFRVSVWYHQDEQSFLRIVPFSIEQFKLIFSALLEKKYNPTDLKNLIDKCLAVREKVRAPEWKRIIEEETVRWKQEITSSQVLPNDTLFFSDLIPEGSFEGGCLPVYDLQAVATAFGEQPTPSVKGWKRMAGRRCEPDMFIAQVVGRSMEPTIKDGSWCLFRFNPEGSRHGVYLIESRLVTDPETQQSFTIKRYYSKKKQMKDGRWRHEEIRLSPDNKAFKEIVLKNVSGDDFRVVAEFVCCL